MVGKKGGGHSSPSHQNGASASSSLASEKPGKEQSRPVKASSTLKQRIWAKVEASLWVLGALFALVYGDGQHNLPHVLLHDPRLKRVWLYVGCGFLIINFLIFLYLRLWLQWYRGIREDWVKAAPIAIPMSTFSWLCAGVTFSVGLWPAMKYAGPFALAAIFMGLLMAHHLLPSAWKRPLLRGA